MKLSVKEMCLFSIFGAVMYASKLVMSFIPNVHLIGVFVVSLTVIYKKKALYPIYIYVFLCGFFSGFGVWWIAQLYIWLILWGLVMIIPKKIPDKTKTAIYMIVCSMHGFLYGFLYLPVQAVFFNFDLNKVLSWYMAGIPWDITHGVSNLICSVLVVPIIMIIQRGDSDVKKI